MGSMGHVMGHVEETMSWNSTTMHQSPAPTMHQSPGSFESPVPSVLDLTDESLMDDILGEEVPDQGDRKRMPGVVIFSAT